MTVRAIVPAIPALGAAALAFLGALDMLSLPTGSLPIRLAIVVAYLALGLALSVVLDRSYSRPNWQSAFAATVVLLPILALQAAASRVPFVALGRGSAGPLIWLTFAAGFALTGLWLLAARQSDRSPQDSALHFLPAALLVPAVVGAPGSLDETSALIVLSEAFLVAGVAMFIGALAPQHWRPIAGAIALGVQFVLLWTLGRGPVLGPHGGTIVPVCAGLLLALTALLTVLTPLASLISRRFLQTVADETVGYRLSAPERGARRAER
ncbi:MAG: hypothetical protein U0031_21260 [Thermomicrobiales bacterium]